MRFAVGDPVNVDAAIVWSHCIELSFVRHILLGLLGFICFWTSDFWDTATRTLDTAFEMKWVKYWLGSLEVTCRSIGPVGSIVRVWHHMCRTDEISFCCLLFVVSYFCLLFSSWCFVLVVAVAVECAQFAHHLLVSLNRLRVYKQLPHSSSISHAHMLKFGRRCDWKWHSCSLKTISARAAQGFPQKREWFIEEFRHSYWWSFSQVSILPNSWQEFFEVGQDELFFWGLRMVQVMFWWRCIEVGLFVGLGSY